MLRKLLVIFIILLMISTLSVDAIKLPIYRTETKLEQDKPINEVFPDINIAEKVRQVLNKGSVNDTITQADLDTITTIDFNTQRPTDATSVKDLTGLRYLTNLTSLSLGGSNISSLDEISELIKITRLDLPMSTIEDLSGISKLVNIEYIYASRASRIKDLSPLSGMTKLSFLQLFDTNVEDVSPLVNAANLETLIIAAHVKDFTPILNHPKLSKLVLYYNAIQDARIFNNMATRPSIDLSRQRIELNPVIRNNSEMRVPVTILDPDGNVIEPSVIHDGGVYENGEVVWRNFNPTEKVTGFDFNKNITIKNASGDINVTYSGTVRFQILDQEPIVISSDPLFRIALGSNVDETKFLELINASTNDGTAVTSNFNTVVDKTTIGEYQVELNASNGLTSAEPVNVIVRVKQLEIDKVDPIDQVVTKNVKEIVAYVGEPFILMTNIKQSQQGNGWGYNSDNFNATFNSPATFTPIHQGQTVINYTTIGGVYTEVNIIIKQRDIDPTNPELPNTGQLMLMPLIGVGLISSGLLLLLKKRQK